MARKVTFPTVTVSAVNADNLSRYCALAARRAELLLDAGWRWWSSGGLGDLLRFRRPWPVCRPYERRFIRLYSIGGGLGDELMCTAIFREIHRLNPSCQVTFLSRHPEIFQKNPHLHAVEPFSLARCRGAFPLWYVPKPPRPLITMMAECIGLPLSTDRLEPPSVVPSAGLRARVAGAPGPRIVIQPQSSRWTPNKQWPRELWVRLIEMLVEKFDVIEAGTEPLFYAQQFGPRFHSLAGETSVSDFVWLVSQATVFVGPPSAGMHCANAFQIPTVAIFGGYESPEGYRYPWAEALFTPVECAPCWLEEPCPYDRKCLRAIEPWQVFRAIVKAVK